MSGFVYVWFDRKNRMYYVGSHWTGRTRSEETRSKMAEARRRWWAERRVAAG